MPVRVRGVEEAFELFDLAIRLVEQRYRREHPDATDEDVDRRVRAWLMDRPGAPAGDAPGVVRRSD